MLDQDDHKGSKTWHGSNQSHSSWVKRSDYVLELFSNGISMSYKKRGNQRWNQSLGQANLKDGDATHRDGKTVNEVSLRGRIRLVLEMVSLRCFIDFQMEIWGRHLDMWIWSCIQGSWMEI